MHGLTQEEFTARRRAEWDELERVLARASRAGLAGLGPRDLEAAARLYRRAVADLAYAQSYFPGSRVEGYLSRLVVRGHAQLYAESPGAVRSAVDFYARAFPRLVRRMLPAVLLAAAILVLGGIAGFWAVQANPALARAVVPDWVRVLRPELPDGQVLGPAERPVISALILVNNVRVAVLALALGISAGLGTAYVLFQNGVLLGGLAARFHAAGLGWPFWSLILPHGWLELTAVALAGGAGFVLGWAVIDPGPYTRREALGRRGRDALSILLGTLPMWLVAAGVEGFVTPLAIPAAWKYAVGAGVGLAAWLYLALAGRRGPADEEAPAREGGQAAPTARF